MEEDQESTRQQREGRSILLVPPPPTTSTPAVTTSEWTRQLHRSTRRRTRTGDSTLSLSLGSSAAVSPLEGGGRGEEGELLRNQGREGAIWRAAPRREQLTGVRLGEVTLEPRLEESGSSGTGTTRLL